MPVALLTEVREVGRKPKSKAPEPDHIPSQYNVRLNDPELERRVYETYTALGLDGANFLRLMIRQCLPIYERQAQEVRDRKPPEK